MAAVDVRESWGLHLRLLRIAGLWPPEGSSVVLRALGMLHLAFAWTCFLMFFLSGAINSFFINDVHELGESVSVALTNLLTLAKMVPFVIWRKRVKQCVDRLGVELFPSARLLLGAGREELVLDAVRRSRQVALGLVSLVMFTVSSALVAPLIELATVRCAAPLAETNATLATPECEPLALRLPYNAWFPWDWSRPPAYQFTYVLQAVGNVQTALLASATDTFFLALLHGLCAQFVLLGHALRSSPASRYAPESVPGPTLAAASSSLTSRVQEDREPFSTGLPHKVLSVRLSDPRDQHLLRCIIFHQHLLRYVNEMRWILSPILFGEILVMMVVLCMITLHATLVPINSAAFVSFLAFYAVETSQLLLYCWFCNDLKDQSEEVSAAVYSSDWVTAENSVKHNLAVFMQRASCSVKMDALGFVNIDMDLFTSVMRASYSFYTVLSQMNDVDEA